MRRKGERGAITLFVLIAGFSFITFLIAMLMIGAAKSQIQTEAAKQARYIYSDGDANTIYNDYFAEGAVPIYTVAQLEQMCSGNKVTINEEGGKIYTFSNNAVYLLMNDLEFAYTGEGIWHLPNFEGNGRFEGNGKTIAVKYANNDTYYYNRENNYENTITVTYNLDLNNMNVWNKQFAERFNISYNSSTNMSTVSMTGDSGYEMLYIPIITTVGKTYNFVLDFQNPNGYAEFSTYGGIGVQALKTVDYTDNCANQLAMINLPGTQNAATKTYRLTFTATDTTTYIGFNFGMAADYNAVTVLMGNFRLIDNLEYGTTLGTSLVTLTKSGYTFGWYTSKVGENQINSSTAVPTENKTYYSRLSLINYTIAYNLDGGSISGQTSYNIETDTFTIPTPTKTGYNFYGWTGSNDLSSGLASYTTSSPYNAAYRDHGIGNAFTVTPGTTYRVFVTAKRTKGDTSMRGGIWYTEQSSGSAWDGHNTGGYGNGVFIRIKSLSDGWGVYYKDVTVPEGKSKGIFYIQLEQWPDNYTTAWSLADMHVINLSASVQIKKGSTGNKAYTAVFTDNMLVNANTIPELLANSATAIETWRKASNTGGSRTIISISSPPEEGIYKGFEIPGQGNHQDIAQDLIPVISGKQYIMSVWAKGTGTLNLQLAGQSPWTNETFTLNNVTTWTKYSWTVTAGSSSGQATMWNGTVNAYFGNYGATGTTIQICGMRLVQK